MRALGPAAGEAEERSTAGGEVGGGEAAAASPPGEAWAAGGEPAAQPPGEAWVHPGESSFEFRALSAALESIVARLALRSRALVPEVQSLVGALQGPGGESGADGLGRAAPLRLVALNTQLARLASDVEDVRDALSGLLESDEDLSGLYLQRGAAARRAASDHAEAELLLEGFARSVEEVASELDAMRDALRFTESYVRTRLDAGRNELLRLDTMLTMGTLSLAAGGLVCAAFGMNLASGLEESSRAFGAACAAAGATTGGVFVGLYASASRTLRSM